MAAQLALLCAHMLRGSNGAQAYSGMRCVTFLPQELQRPDEGLCAHLPAVHICPLVDLHGQIPVALNPLGKHVVHHGL